MTCTDKIVKQQSAAMITKLTQQNKLKSKFNSTQNNNKFLPLTSYNEICFWCFF